MEAAAVLMPVGVLVSEECVFSHCVFVLWWVQLQGSFEELVGSLKHEAQQLQDAHTHELQERDRQVTRNP